MGCDRFCFVRGFVRVVCTLGGAPRTAWGSRGLRARRVGDIIARTAMPSRPLPALGSSSVGSRVGHNARGACRSEQCNIALHKLKKRLNAMRDGKQSKSDYKVDAVTCAICPVCYRNLPYICYSIRKCRTAPLCP